MQVQLCAHRGAVNDKSPENTLPAFKRAVRLGAGAIELDVRRCKSGEIVVIHDKRVDRTTNGRGKVRHLTLTELRQLDAGNGTHIPTLDEVLRDLQHRLPGGQSPTVFVELKTHGRPFLKQTLETLQTACSQYGYRPEQLPVISFYWGQLRWIRRHWPVVRTCANISHIFFYPDSLAQLAQRAQMQLVNIPHKLLSRQLVASLHKRGIQVSTWTVNKPAAVRRAALCQADYIMTDDITGARAALEELNATA
jgi:glycerophosphoryl diester phosphodiesterase